MAVDKILLAKLFNAVKNPTVQTFAQGEESEKWTWADALKLVEPQSPAVMEALGKKLSISQSDKLVSGNLHVSKYVQNLFSKIKATTAAQQGILLDKYNALRTQGNEYDTLVVEEEEMRQILVMNEMTPRDVERKRILMSNLPEHAAPTVAAAEARKADIRSSKLELSKYFQDVKIRAAQRLMSNQNSTAESVKVLVSSSADAGSGSGSAGYGAMSADSRGSTSWSGGDHSQDGWGGGHWRGSNRGGGGHRGGRGGRSGGAPRYQFNGTCNSCGELGHIARDCPSKNNNYNYNRAVVRQAQITPQIEPQMIFCQRCYVYHLNTECPPQMREEAAKANNSMRNQNNNQNQTDGYNQNNSNRSRFNAFVVHSVHTNCPLKPGKIQFDSASDMHLTDDIGLFVQGTIVSCQNQLNLWG